MKLKDLISAVEPLKRLSEKRFASYKKMREIVKLRKAVEQEFDFYKGEESKAIKAYGEFTKEGTPKFLPDGRLQLKDYESKVAFEKEVTELRETEVDSIELVTLRESDFRSSDDLPTPDDMLALEWVVAFED